MIPVTLNEVIWSIESNKKIKKYQISTGSRGYILRINFKLNSGTIRKTKVLISTKEDILKIKDLFYDD